MARLAVILPILLFLPLAAAAQESEWFRLETWAERDGQWARRDCVWIRRGDLASSGRLAPHLELCDEGVRHQPEPDRALCASCVDEEARVWQARNAANLAWSMREELCRSIEGCLPEARRLFSQGAGAGEAPRAPSLPEEREEVLVDRLEGEGVRIDVYAAGAPPQETPAPGRSLGDLRGTYAELGQILRPASNAEPMTLQERRQALVALLAEHWGVGEDEALRFLSQDDTRSPKKLYRGKPSGS